MRLKKSHAKSLASSNSPEKARAYAFLLLKFRLRSSEELKFRLKQKGFSQELCQQTVDFLKEKEFIDDAVFARSWVSSRLKRPFGFRKIQQELQLKGVDQEIIQRSLAKAKEEYNEADIVSQLAQQRFSRIKGIEPIKAKVRVYAYLVRRGFAPEVVGDIVKKL